MRAGLSATVYTLYMMTSLFPMILQVWPDDELPEFQLVTAEFQKKCQKLSLRILTLMAIGLGLVRE